MTYLLRALDPRGQQLGATLEFEATDQEAAFDRYEDHCTLASVLGGTIELLKDGERLALFHKDPPPEARFSAAPDGTTEDKKP